MSGGVPVRILYTIAACWFGTSFILFWVVVACDIVGLVFRVRGFHLGVAALGVTAMLAVASIINAQFIRVKTVDMPSFGKELRAVLLTDIHIGTVWSGEHLRKIVAMTNALQPDVVFITGDIVSGGTLLTPGLFAPLADIHAPAFFAYGNHEHYEGIEEVKKALDGTGVRILCDEKTDLNGIEIVGVDYRRRDGHTQSVLNELGVSRDKPTILMHHIPIDPQHEGVTLVLSGHTHNGQIVPFNFVVQLRYKFVHGLYTFGDTRLYVSPGTGTWGPPMRLGSMNEITLFKLH
jgi:predicted MPP superfamily phosphohydrolase